VPKPGSLAVSRSLHHLPAARPARPGGGEAPGRGTSALRVEGVIRHPPLEEPWEYFVVIAIRNDRGEEVTRQVVSVGALQSTRSAPSRCRSRCCSAAR